MLDKSDPATAICLAARKGDLRFLSEQLQAKLLLLNGNGDSVITHAVYSGNMRSLEFLFILPLCVHTLLNLPSEEGNYPLWVAVTKNRVECAERLLAAGARIMVPVNHFENHTATPDPILHEIIYSQACPEAGRVDAGGDGDRLPLLAIMLRDLLTNPKRKYTWAQQVSILLFRTIIDQDVTGTQIRAPLELAQFLGLREAARQLAVVQKMLPWFVS